jgi:hypothetical protein
MAPNGVGSFSSASHEAGLAEYQVTVLEEGDYVIWARVIAPTGKDDSFFAAMDDGSFKRWNVERSEIWTWDKINEHKGADPLLFNLTVGSHTFYLMQREDGTKLDKIIITKDFEFKP